MKEGHLALNHNKGHISKRTQDLKQKDLGSYG